MNGQGYFGSASPGMDVDSVPVRNVYPGAPGGTLATMGSASSPDTMGSAAAVAPGTPAVSAQITDTSPGGKPLAWWVAIVIIVALIHIVARKTGDAGEFSNLRASTYNVTLITLISILGITVMKIFATKFGKVRGLSG